VTRVMGRGGHSYPQCSSLVLSEFTAALVHTYLPRTVCHTIFILDVRPFIMKTWTLFLFSTSRVTRHLVPLDLLYPRLRAAVRSAPPPTSPFLSPLPFSSPLPPFPERERERQRGGEREEERERESVETTWECRCKQGSPILRM